MNPEIPPGASQRLDQLLKGFDTEAPYLVGYPINQDMDYSGLFPFLRYAANNVGDPFQGSNLRLNTHDIEREVVHAFAGFMSLDRDQVWGYVTSGGTEGNMYGLYMGRELHPDGTVYFSQETHYSVVKLLRLLGMRSVMIRSQPSGEMDYDDLRESVRINPDTPHIILANIGTTIKGAIDDLSIIREILDDLGVPNSYIHADAALSGMILPFVADPRPHGFGAGIDSIAVSGHKLIVSPVPCGVVITRKDYVSRIARSIEYVGVLDTTIPGLPQRLLTPDHLARPPETRQRRLHGDCGAHARHCGVRRGPVQRIGYSRVAEPQLRNRRLSEARPPGLREMVDSALGQRRPHHHHAARHPGHHRRTCRRLRQMEGLDNMERIVVIANDQPGVIADLSTALAEAGPNIESLNTEKAGDQGVITLTTSDTDSALRALTQAGFRATTDVPIIFLLPDEPGALARIAQRFKEQDINIQSLHILDRRAGNAIVALTTMDREQALALIDPESLI